MGPIRTLTTIIWCIVAVITIVLYAIHGQEHPTISMKVTLSQPSPDELSSINSKYANPDHAKKLYVQIRIDHSKQLRDREIEVPSVADMLNHGDRTRVITGGGFEQNNVGTEDFAVSEQYILFDAEGLDEEKIRDALDSSYAYVRWTAPDGQKSEDRISLADLLHVEE